MPEVLLISRDSNLISTMQVACSKSVIDLTHCPEPANASGLLERRKFYAVLVDDNDPAATTDFLQAVRRSPSSSRAMSIVFAAGPTTAATDAALVVSKPVSMELALRMLRAAQGPMSMELRRYARRSLRVPITLTTVKQDVKAVLINISDGGLSVRFSDHHTLPVTTALTARFSLPPSNEWVQVNGEVLWCDAEGRAGLRCSGVTNTDRERLRKWLATQI